MADKYTGWKLFDKITIVARQMRKWDSDKWEYYFIDEYQGYIVDPSNKKQLESARRWGEETIFEYFTDENGKRSVRHKEVSPPKEYTYENKDFTLELSEAANGSCQGGKLSFWNCWITASDGKRFLVGIAADLLLDVLKSTTVINGVVQEKLMFARCKGGVGMLCENMDSYKDALKDESARKNSSKGKTSKHKIGHVYATLTQKNVYLGNFYQWYEQIWEVRPDKYYPYREANQLVGFRKLDKPIELKWFPTYYEDKDVDYYVKHFGMYQCEEKLPARREGDYEPVELPNLDECIEKICERHRETIDKYLDAKSKGLTMSRYIDNREIGISTSSTEYTMPLHQRELLIEFGYRIED